MVLFVLRSLTIDFCTIVGNDYGNHVTRPILSRSRALYQHQRQQRGQRARGAYGPRGGRLLRGPDLLERVLGATIRLHSVRSYDAGISGKKLCASHYFMNFIIRFCRCYYHHT